MSAHEQDSYNGHWDGRRVAEDGDNEPAKREVPSGKWPIELPACKSTTMSLNKDGDIYCWTCKECGVSMVTTTYARPDHMCVFRKEEE